MIAADKVMQTLKRVMLVDGFDVVIDFDKSAGSRIVDARTGKAYLDMFTFVASHPLGMNHPRLAEPAFVQRLGRTAVNKPSNSDIYCAEMAEFVEEFTTRAAPPWMKHLFLVSGGTLAVENALKVAFDWKVRKNLARGKGEKGSQVIHFRECFHGRSGYTLSMTNTDPGKTKYFPRFDWPRLDNPKMIFPCEGQNLEMVQEAEARVLESLDAVLTERGDDIAALILEPIQGEGGDNHFRPEFLAALRRSCSDNEVFFVLDEVQTGMGMTGRWWAHEALGVEPDAIAFGKKTQVCGIAVGARVDEVEKNCFQESSRINSTWGGNLVDMLRSTRFLDIIEEEDLLSNAARRGNEAVQRLHELQAEIPEQITNVRGLGLFLAFDLAEPALRPRILQRAFHHGLLILPSGTRSIRLRPALNVATAEIEEAVEILGRSIREVLATRGSGRSTADIGA